jgi:hypothetical protein
VGVKLENTLHLLSPPPLARRCALLLSTRSLFGCGRPGYPAAGVSGTLETPRIASSPVSLLLFPAAAGTYLLGVVVLADRIDFVTLPCSGGLFFFAVILSID